MLRGKEKARLDFIRTGGTEQSAYPPFVSRFQASLFPLPSAPLFTRSTHLLHSSCLARAAPSPSSPRTGTDSRAYTRGSSYKSTKRAQQGTETGVAWPVDTVLAAEALLSTSVLPYSPPLSSFPKRWCAGSSQSNHTFCRRSRLSVGRHCRAMAAGKAG